MLTDLSKMNASTEAN